MSPPPYYPGPSPRSNLTPATPMTLRTWRRITWAYHLVFAAAVIWPFQTLVNTPDPLVLGLPRQMAWAAGWVAGSLLVLWRLDAARIRRERSGPLPPGRDD